MELEICSIAFLVVAICHYMLMVSYILALGLYDQCVLSQVGLLFFPLDEVIALTIYSVFFFFFSSFFCFFLVDQGL